MTPKLETKPPALKSIGDWAAFYAFNGWLVLPLHYVDDSGNCSCGNVGKCATEQGARGKHPAAKHAPNGLRDATKDVAQVRKWWADGKPWNIGAIPNAGEFRLDVDTQHGGDSTLSELELRYGPLPECPQVRTQRGGSHYYLGTNGHAVRSKSKALGDAYPGLDTKTVGTGYTIVPPSRGFYGPYQWAVEPWDVDTPDAPDWLLDLLKEPPPEERERLGPLPDVIPKGQRDDTAFRYACAVHNYGLGLADIRDFLELLNRRCDPPLPPDVLDQKAAQAAKYPVGEAPGRVVYIPAPTDADAPPGAVPEGRNAGTPEELPPVVYLDLDELAKTGIPPVRWLVDGWLAERDVLVLGGGAFDGKTTLAAWLTRCGARGTDWLGHEVPEPFGVLWVDAEQGADDTARMLLRTGAAPHPNVHACTGQGLNLSTDAGLERLLREVKAKGVRVVVLDSLQHMAAGVEENSASEMGEFFRRVFQLRDEGGVAVVLLHHKTKQGVVQREPLEMLRGSSAIGTQASAIWFISPGGEDYKLLRQVKSRGGKKRSMNVYLELDPDDPDNGPLALRGETLDTATDQLVRNAVLRFLGEFGEARTAALVEAGKRDGHKERTIKRTLKRMAEDGLLTKPAQGVYRLASYKEAF